MKAKKFWSALLIGIVLGCVGFFAGNRESVKAEEEVTVVEEQELTGNVVYNGAAKIANRIDLNGYVLWVNGDLEIAANVILNKGTLIVNGNILHSSGSVSVGRGILEVSGDYRFQKKRILDDGTEEFISSDGYINMAESDGVMKIGRNFVVQRYYYYSTDFNKGEIEIGGNLIVKGGRSNSSHNRWKNKIIFYGKEAHKVENEGEFKFGDLESEGEIIWKGDTVTIDRMLSDLTIKLDGKEELVVGAINVNGKHLNLNSDIKMVENIILNAGIINIEGNVLWAGGSIDMNYGSVNIEGSVLQTGGSILIGNGIMEISGDYRIQNVRNLADGTMQYIGSNGYLSMQHEDGLLKIGGDFVTQSMINNRSNCYHGGVMEIGGDIIQKNGDAKNFVCSYDHKIILTGGKGQKVEFESPDATFNTLVITRPFSEYTFTPNSCWKYLEEAAVSLSECTVKNITKKAYTGKEIKPIVTITFQDKKLVQNTDYTLSYSNNINTGKGTVTITGIGAYTGMLEKTFQIVPAKVTDVKALSSAAKQVTLTWKKDATATGYVLEYSTDKTFKKNVSKITVNKKETISEEVTKLTSKKTYFFRIRAYKTIDGKKAYGAYSSVVSVQVK